MGWLRGRVTMVFRRLFARDCRAVSSWWVIPFCQSKRGIFWRHLHGVTRFRVGSRFVLLFEDHLGGYIFLHGWLAGKNITHCVLVAQRGVRRFVW